MDIELLEKTLDQLTSHSTLNNDLIVSERRKAIISDVLIKFSEMLQYSIKTAREDFKVPDPFTASGLWCSGPDTHKLANAALSTCKSSSLSQTADPGKRLALNRLHCYILDTYAVLHNVFEPDDKRMSGLKWLEEEIKGIRSKRDQYDTETNRLESLFRAGLQVNSNCLENARVSRGAADYLTEIITQVENALVEVIRDDVDGGR